MSRHRKELRGALGHGLCVNPSLDVCLPQSTHGVISLLLQSGLQNPVKTNTTTAKHQHTSKYFQLAQLRTKQLQACCVNFSERRLVNQQNSC